MERQDSTLYITKVFCFWQLFFLFLIPFPWQVPKNSQGLRFATYFYLISRRNHRKFLSKIAILEMRNSHQVRELWKIQAKVLKIPAKTVNFQKTFRFLIASNFTENDFFTGIYQGFALNFKRRYFTLHCIISLVLMMIQQKNVHKIFLKNNNMKQ